MLRIRAFAHPMGISVFWVGLVPEVGHVPLGLRTVHSVEAAQDVEWIQRRYFADVAMHKRDIGKARLFGFPVILDIFLAKATSIKIYRSLSGNKPGVIS